MGFNVDRLLGTHRTPFNPRKALLSQHYYDGVQAGTQNHPLVPLEGFLSDLRAKECKI